MQDAFVGTWKLNPERCELIRIIVRRPEPSCSRATRRAVRDER